MKGRAMVLLVRLIVILLMLAYVGWHVWIVLPLPWWGRLAAVGLVAMGFAAMAVGLSRVADRVPLWLASTAYDVGSTTLIVLAYLLMLCVVADILWLLHVLPAAWLRDNWYTAAVVVLAMAALLVGGNMHYRHKVRVALTPSTHGKRIEQPVRLLAASDLHIGYHNRRQELARWVDMINAEKPDAVLLMGDLIDRSLRPLLEDGAAEELRRIEAPVLACPGNHEYYAAGMYSMAEVEAFYSEAGITLLRDSVVLLNGIAVVGRDDRVNPQRLSVEALMQKVDKRGERYTILLDHQPYNLEEAERAGVDLQLSGHTHHGQFWPGSWITEQVYECAWGSHQRGATDYYVSSGLGIWGPKYRIGTQSEYVVVTIN